MEYSRGAIAGLSQALGGARPTRAGRALANAFCQPDPAISASMPAIPESVLPRSRRVKEAPRLRVDASTASGAFRTRENARGRSPERDVVAGLRDAGPTARPSQYGMHVLSAQRQHVDLGVRERRATAPVLSGRRRRRCRRRAGSTRRARLEVLEIEIALVGEAPDAFARVVELARPALGGAPWASTSCARCRGRASIRGATSGRPPEQDARSARALRTSEVGGVVSRRPIWFRRRRRTSVRKPRGPRPLQDVRGLREDEVLELRRVGDEGVGRREPAHGAVELARRALRRSARRSPRRSPRTGSPR